MPFIYACIYACIYAKAKVVIETWRRQYNEVRPHSSPEELTPIEFKTRYYSTNPGAVLQL